MRKIFLLVFVVAGMLIQAEEKIKKDAFTPIEQTSTSVEDTNMPAKEPKTPDVKTSENKTSDTSTQESKTPEAQTTQKQDTEEPTPETKLSESKPPQANPKDLFKPIEPNGSTYGAFRIGYVYQSLSSKQIPLKNNENSYRLNSHNAYFGLERGWVGGPKKILMIGAYLDLGAGNIYYGSVGGVFSLRLLNGWLIPKISLGYQLQHLGLPDDSAQYNIQSGVGTIGVYANIAQGFGVGLEVRGGIPFQMVRLADSYNNPKFDMYSVMVSFNFYDFGI